jgi:hypothetical protein
VDCRCDTVTELYGNEAEEYARGHLVAGRSASEPPEERFSCPDTGREWVLDYPDRTERELAQARLRVV